MTTISPVDVTFEHILVLTDSADLSSREVEYAKSIAKADNSELLLVHVDQSGNRITPPEAARTSQSGSLELEREQLEQGVATLRAEGFQAHAIWLTGLLQDEVLSVIKQHEVDLIVFGTHGKSGFERLLLGSDAEAVLRNASCPVLSVGPAVADPGQGLWRPHEVICATTLDSSSAGIAAYAYAIALHYEAQFMLYHVDDRGRHKDVDWDAFEQAFRRQIPKEFDPCLPLRTCLTRTTAGTSIVDLAKERGSDLIVMGARTASLMATHLARGDAAKLLADASCPVLTLQL